jgi:hypothetical protein
MTANMASTASHPQNTNLFARCRQAKSPRPARNIIARIIVMMFSGSSTPVSSRQRSLTVNRLLKVRGFAVSQRLISSNRTSAFQSVTRRYVPNLNVRCRFRKWCVLCLARRCRNSRLAVNPPNAMLNYMYALLESESPNPFRLNNRVAWRTVNFDRSQRGGSMFQSAMSR